MEAITLGELVKGLLVLPGVIEGLAQAERELHTVAGFQFGVCPKRLHRCGVRVAYLVGAQ